MLNDRDPIEKLGMEGAYCPCFTLSAAFGAVLPV
jgi:hypothetical protein